MVNITSIDVIKSLIRLENNVSKEEIAPYEQFFRKLYAAEASESVCMWERVNLMNNHIPSGNMLIKSFFYFLRSVLHLARNTDFD